MTNEPVTIRSVLLQPGLGVVYEPLTAVYHPTETVSLGLVFDKLAPMWLECPVMAGQTAVQLADTMRQTVVPLLTGRVLDDFRALSAELDGLQETIVVEHELPLPAAVEKPPAFVSRRGFLRGDDPVRPPRPEPVIEREVVERPLSPHIRLTTSLVLLEAFAAARRQPVAAFLAEAYGLARAETAVSILINLPTTELAITPATLKNHVAAIAATSRSVADLGKQGKELQKYARQLVEWLKAYGDYAPALHLNTRGGIGDSFNNSSGLCFGLLFGIGMAAAPQTIRFEDPVWLQSQAAQLAEMSKLREYIRRRRTTVQLVAQAWLDSLADVHLFLEKKAAHMLHLSLTKLGSVDHLLAAVAACRAAEVGVLLSDGAWVWGENGRFARLLAHIALAAQPDLVTLTATPAGDAGLGLLHNEMARTVRWLGENGRFSP